MVVPRQVYLEVVDLLQTLEHTVLLPNHQLRVEESLVEQLLELQLHLVPLMGCAEVVGVAEEDPFLYHETR